MAKTKKLIGKSLRISTDKNKIYELDCLIFLFLWSPKVAMMFLKLSEIFVKSLLIKYDPVFRRITLVSYDRTNFIEKL